MTRPSSISPPSRSWLLVFPLLLIVVACSSSNGGDDSNTGDLPDAGRPLLSAGATLDPTRMALTSISMAVGPNDRVGVAYFRDSPASDGGTNYQVRYVEWQNGQVSQSQLVQTVSLEYGISLAFQGNGQPAIAYLGGGDDGTHSLFWVNSDAAISYRQPGGSWTESIAARKSTDVTPLCGNPVSDNPNGFVVGINPALVFIGSAAYLIYRDVHEGQFPVQDWAGSDLKVAIGGPSTWTNVPIQCGGNDKQAYGGHSAAVVVPGSQPQPALVSDQVFGSPNGFGANVLFHKRNSDGSWVGKTSPPVATIGNTQKGPSLAYDSVLGFAVAVTDRGSNTLNFLSSQTGTGIWTVPDPVFQSGTGGWYPSLVVDPSIHEPAIAYYICSRRPGVAEGSCPASENQLRLASRYGTVWNHSILDAQGGVFPKLGFLSSGKRVVAYRDPTTGALKLFVDP